MPAPKKNQNAAQPVTRDAKCDFRTYRARKGAYVLASYLEGQKLTPWLESILDPAAEAILKKHGEDAVLEELRAVQKLREKK